MKIILALLILISVILESTFFSFPLTLIVIAVCASYLDKNAKIVAFLTGLLLDIFSMRLIGADSLFFLSLLLVEERYQKKFHSGRFLFRINFLFLAVVIYNLLFYRYLDFGKLVAAVGFGAILMFLSRQILSKTEVKKRLAI